jgi:hypothetical protein
MHYKYTIKLYKRHSALVPVLCKSQPTSILHYYFLVSLIFLYDKISTVICSRLEFIKYAIMELANYKFLYYFLLKLANYNIYACSVISIILNQEKCVIKDSIKLFGIQLTQ